MEDTILGGIGIVGVLAILIGLSSLTHSWIHRKRKEWKEWRPAFVVYHRDWEEDEKGNIIRPPDASP
jgi:hypothetical protein